MLDPVLQPRDVFGDLPVNLRANCLWVAAGCQRLAGNENASADDRCADQNVAPVEVTGWLGHFGLLIVDDTAILADGFACVEAQAVEIVSTQRIASFSVYGGFALLQGGWSVF